MNNFAARCVERMDWDRRYQIGDIPWEKGAPAPPLLEWLQACGPLHGNILVPGCGYGHDVRAIAAAAPDAKVIGLDISQLAIERARQFPVAGQEAYELGDLFNLPERFSGAFQWVFEHTCFCVIDPERRFDYVRAIAGALRSGGFLLAIFFSIHGTKGKNPQEAVLPLVCRLQSSISFLDAFLTGLMRSILAPLFQGARAGKSSGCSGKGERAIEAVNTESNGCRLETASRLPKTLRTSRRK